MDHGTDFHGLRDSDPSWALPPESGAQYRMGGLGFGLPMSRLYAEYFGEPLHCFNLGCVISNDVNQNTCQSGLGACGASLTSPGRLVLSS